MKRILLTLALLFAPSLAWGQCTGVFVPGTVCGNDGAANTTPHMVGAGSGSLVTTGLNITRIQIPTKSKLPTTFSVGGYRTLNDLGQQCIYTSVSATSSGIGAIQSADGVWFNLSFASGTVNVGCFGAYADASGRALVTADLTANPWWRGAYTTAWSWDTVALQEAQFAALASGSVPNTNTVGSAYLANPQGNVFSSGAGCTTGVQTFTVVGGTGTAATITGTVLNGGLKSSQPPLAIATPGSYSVFPTSPVTLTGGGCSTAPTAVIQPASIVWNSSPAFVTGLNKDIYLPCAVGGSGTYAVNQPMILVASRFNINFCSGAVISWSGSTAATMWNWDSASYFTVNRMWLTSTQTPDYNTAAPLLSINYDTAYPGLAPQNGIFNSAFIGLSSNGRGIAIAPSGGAAQGSTITFNNLQCAGFASDYCIGLTGGNAFNVVLNNGDCQGFTHDCIQNSGGTVAINDTTFENQQTFFGFTPITNQFTTYGADIHMYSGSYIANVNSIKGADRSESDVGVLCEGGSFCDIQTYGLTHVSSFGWFPSNLYYIGNSLYSQPGCGGSPTSCVGTKYHTFMVVDDGGNVTWPAVGTGSTTTVIQDPTASYSVNQWAGYIFYFRASNGFTTTTTITSNTATTITLSAPLSRLPIAGDNYHIGGLTGASPPAWDSAVNGQSTLGLGNTGAGVSTVAGSNVVYAVNFLNSSDLPNIAVNDYVVIPNADCLGTSPIYPAALIAKVTAINTPSGGFLTINKNACNTVGNGSGSGGAYAYRGTPFTDGQISYIDLDYNAYSGTGGATVHMTNVFTASGRIVGIDNYLNFKNLRPDWQRPSEPSATVSGANPSCYNCPVSDYFIGGPLLRPLNALTAAATIDLSQMVLSGDAATLVPAQDEAINFPALTATSSRRFTLMITTSGTTPYTLTCGTNVTCRGTLSTGAVSGSVFAWAFEWNGTKWVESSRSGPTVTSPPSGAAGGALAGTYPNPTYAGTVPTVAHGIVAATNNIAVSHTGDTTETILGTIAVPAIPAGAQIRLTVLFSYTGVAGTKTPRVYYGATGSGTSGTKYYEIALSAATLSQRFQPQILNRTTSSQVGVSNGLPNTFGSTTLAGITSSITTTVATELTISGQLANSGDAVTLEGTTFEIILP